jgi:peptide/nickel transport system substrate-binding protein
MKKKVLLIVVSAIVFLLVFSFADGAIKYGGIPSFGIAGSTWMDDFNPFTYGSISYADGLIYEPLFYANYETGDIEPWLATSYEWKDNNLELVFQLHKDIKWSDGVPFTASDVAFTFNLMKKYPALDTAGYWQSGLTSVSTQGTYTVVFKFSRPNTVELPWIAGAIVVPEHIWSKVEDPAKFMNTDPIGTGPFELKSFNQALQIVEMVKNPNYWQSGRPYVDGVKIVNYAGSPSTLLPILKGELDWTAAAFSPEAIKAFTSKDLQNNKVWTVPTSPNYLLPNDTKYPLNIAKFRLAIAMSIDKAKIAELGEYGLGTPADPSGLWEAAVKNWLNPDLKPLEYTYNPQEAIQILESLGFKRDSSGLFINPQTGKPFFFNIVVPAGYTDWIGDAQIIVENLKAIGINSAVEQQSIGQFIGTRSEDLFDFLMTGVYGAYDTYFSTYDYMLNSKYTKPVGESAFADWERWNDPVTDAVLNLIPETSSATVQHRAISVIEQIMLTEVPVIPLYNGYIVNLFTTSKFVGWPDASNPYTTGISWLGQDFEKTFLNIHLK